MQGWRQVAGIAIPVSTEFVILLVLNFITQVIVGGRGSLAIAAVGFANNLTFILVITVSALGLSVSILAARAFGGARRHELDTMVASALIVGGGVALLLSVAIAMWSGPLLHLVGASATVAEAGTEYLRLSSLATVPLVLVAIMSGAMRSIGRPRPPMIATAISAVLTALLTWLLVYGPGPLPDLGLAGAGWAVLVSALARMAILVPQLFGPLISWEMPSRGELGHVVRPLFVLAVPLAVTDLAWSTGTFLYGVVFQRLGDDPLAAAQIVNTLEGTFFMGSIGLIAATNALVGNAIGAADAPAARRWIALVTRIGLVTGVVFGVLYAASSLTLNLLFPNTAVEVRQLAIVGILINAAFMWTKVHNAVTGAGILPSGNDVRGVIIGDVTGAFVIGLPLAIVLGLLTPVGAVGIFVARVVEELAKLGIFRHRARRLDWAALARAHERRQGRDVA